MEKEDCSKIFWIFLPPTEFSRFFEGYYFTIKGYGTTAQLGMRLFRNSAATSAFGRPTSFGLEKK